MRPADYPDQDIIDAGRRLQKRDPGRRITASAIRTELGGGGLSRIKRVWEEHASLALSNMNGAQLLPLTPDDVQVVTALSDDLQVMLGQLYARAKVAAQSQKQSVAARSERTEAERDLALANQRITQLEKENSRLREQLSVAATESATQ